MMETINKAIEMMFARAKEEDENFVLQDGDLAGVFNDGVIIIYLEDERLCVKVIAGEPDRFDFNLDLLEQ